MISEPACRMHEPEPRVRGKCERTVIVDRVVVVTSEIEMDVIALT